MSKSSNTASPIFTQSATIFFFFIHILSSNPILSSLKFPNGVKILRCLLCRSNSDSSIRIRFHLTDLCSSVFDNLLTIQFSPVCINSRLDLLIYNCQVYQDQTWFAKGQIAKIIPSNFCWIDCAPTHSLIWYLVYQSDNRIFRGGGSSLCRGRNWETEIEAPVQVSSFPTVPLILLH